MELAQVAHGTQGGDAPLASTHAARAYSLEKQQQYRANAHEFFRVPEHHARLERLVARGDIGSLLYFFVKHFETHRYVKTRRGLLRVADQYRSALTSHMKRYYDFESREGRGDLDWHGQCNPLVEAREDGGVALPLPRLVAYQWLIYMDFDLYLWDRYEDIGVAFTTFTLAAKQRYQSASQRRRYSAREGGDSSDASGTSTSASTSASTNVVADAPRVVKRARERDNMRRSRARREAGAHAAVFSPGEGDGLHDLVHEEQEHDGERDG